jgi:hypothetical protein
MKSLLPLSIAAALLLAGAADALAQLTNRSSVHNGMGGRSTGGPLTHVGAGAQPGGIAVSSGGSFVNQAGFLNTFFLKPALDSDGDGIPDEIDPDNDNDQLPDQTELLGSSFSPISPTDPNVADTDGDGMSDYAEMIGGSNPTDTNAHLRFTWIAHAGGSQLVEWTARGNNERIYVVKVRGGSYAQPDVVIWSNTVAGGAAPWYETIATNIHAVTTNAQFYSVEVIKP